MVAEAILQKVTLAPAFVLEKIQMLVKFQSFQISLFTQKRSQHVVHFQEKQSPLSFVSDVPPLARTTRTQHLGFIKLGSANDRSFMGLFIVCLHCIQWFVHIV